MLQNLCQQAHHLTAVARRPQQWAAGLASLLSALEVPGHPQWETIQSKPVKRAICHKPATPAKSKGK